MLLCQQAYSITCWRNVSSSAAFSFTQSDMTQFRQKMKEMIIKLGDYYVASNLVKLDISSDTEALSSTLSLTNHEMDKETQASSSLLLLSQTKSGYDLSSPKSTGKETEMGVALSGIEGTKATAATATTATSKKARQLPLTNHEINKLTTVSLKNKETEASSSLFFQAKSGSELSSPKSTDKEKEMAVTKSGIEETKATAAAATTTTTSKTAVTVTTASLTNHELDKETQATSSLLLLSQTTKSGSELSSPKSTDKETEMGLGLIGIEGTKATAAATTTATTAATSNNLCTTGLTNLGKSM